MDSHLADRITIANACRSLALHGLVDDILGHVSLRIDDDTVLIRCRGPHERGLAYTTVDDIRAVRLDGQHDLTDGYQTPNELPLHLEVMRQRPEVRSVVHAHPPRVVAFSLTGRSLLPVVGAFNIPAMRMALGGVPMHLSAALIRSPERAEAMVRTLGDSPVCLLKGHGLAAVGETVAQAVVRALNIDTLAGVHLELLKIGSDPQPIDEGDLSDLPDLGGAFNDENVWRFLMAELAHNGLLVE